MRWCFVVNPMAGGGKAKSEWPWLEAQLIAQGVCFCVEMTEYRKHAIEICRDLALNGERQFVAVGGDGSVNEVLQGILESGIALEEFTLSVLPWGSGNDWARFHQVPTKAKAWLTFFANAQRVHHDVGMAKYGPDWSQSHAFINIAGMGLDTMVLEEMGQAAGLSLRYYLTMLSCLYRYQAVRFNLQCDEKSVETPALMLMSCIGRYGGAGMDFAPLASASNGAFNVLCINDMPFLQRLAGLRYLLNGRINQHPQVDHFTSPSLTITSDRPWHFECDGELIAPLPVKLTTHSQAIYVLSNRRQF